jgi:hypothetical protein
MEMAFVVIVAATHFFFKNNAFDLAKIKKKKNCFSKF